MNKKTSGIIYVTECLVNGKAYVGIHTRGSKRYLGSGIAINRAIQKYGRENFIRHDADEFSTIEEGFAKEMFWIQEMNSKSPNGYNLTDGGEGLVNPSKETRKLMSKKRKAYCVDPEERNKFQARIKAYWADPEARAKASTRITAYFSDPANRAKHSALMKARSPECWAKISASKKAYFSDPANRVKIKAYYAEHPEHGIKAHPPGWSSSAGLIEFFKNPEKQKHAAEYHKLHPEVKRRNRTYAAAYRARKRAEAIAAATKILRSSD